ncbi:PEP-CTERM sorting domain-containing protein [Rubritalea spongiae]|uniref:PEP-CTERM sorting domain-containing protein n=1 Tax=Rubritalea spongiae TaxID=430797 RepID=A0ABW5DXZ7_9BACT
MACTFGAVASTQAATIAYTFENAGNISGAGVDQVYTAPDVNEFGAGITFSDFTMTEESAAHVSRIADIGPGSVSAAGVDRANPLSFEFTVTILSSASVTFDQVSFDTLYRSSNNITGDVNWTFETVVGSDPAANVKSGTMSLVGQSTKVENSGLIDLSGLDNLSDTTVTFRWTLDGAWSNTWNNKRMGMDNITISSVPEPSSTALLGLGGIAMILRRRRA